jgi:hypothetical protein
MSGGYECWNVLGGGCEDDETIALCALVHDLVAVSDGELDLLDTVAVGLAPLLAKDLYFPFTLKQ